MGKCLGVPIPSVLALDEIQLKQQQQHYYIWQEQRIHNEQF